LNNIKQNSSRTEKKELKKYNHIIDSKKPKDMTLLARNLMNVLLYIRQQEGSDEFNVPIAKLKSYLNLSTKDYKARIEKAIYELSIPIELRDFTYKGKEISYVPAALLIEPTIYKENINFVNIKISDKFIAAIEEKIGYTILDFMQLAKCTTKFGHEIAQMIFRYKNLPNKVANDVVRVTKTMQELNYMFGTNYKYLSDMTRKLDSGYKDIQDTLKIEYFYSYDTKAKEFVFSWLRDIKTKDNCLFPPSRLKELALWIFEHYEKKTGNTVLDKNKFLSSCISKLRDGTWEDAQKAYQGMLQYKYGLMSEMYFDYETNKYIDFKEQAKE